MSWDFYIYSIKHQTLKDNLREVLGKVKVSKGDQAFFKRKFENSVEIEDIEMLKYSMYVDCKPGEWREMFLPRLGIAELESFRSKSSCFAMAQMVSYYDESLPNPHARFKQGKYGMILSYAEIARLLKWLTIISRLLDGTNPSELFWEGYNEELILEAQKLMNKGGCERQEFIGFRHLHSMFNNWNILGEGYYYHWHNSY